MTRTVDLEEARSHFSELVALLDSETEIVVTDNNRPVARIVAPRPTPGSPILQGVEHVDGPTGLRAVVSGTGIDVWEIIANWHACEKNTSELRDCYPWLTEEQLHSAITYYEDHPNEIDERLKRERRWTQERVYRELPFAKPIPSTDIT